MCCTQIYNKFSKFMFTRMNVSRQTTCHAKQRVTPNNCGPSCYLATFRTPAPTPARSLSVRSVFSRCIDKLPLQKSLHSIALDQAELKGRMMQFSQERYVNGLLNQLTELTFQSTDADQSLSGVNPR